MKKEVTWSLYNIKKIIVQNLKAKVKFAETEETMGARITFQRRNGKGPPRIIGKQTKRST